MLFFLDLCSRQGILVDQYSDQSEGLLEKDNNGNLSITIVTLKPKTIFSGSNILTADEIKNIHHKAHQLCFIVNSVKT